MEITLKIGGSDVRFNPEVETQIFRIVQQATNNAIMHSGASLIAIKGTIMPERIELIVEDNGKGIEPTNLDPEYLMTEKHYGIIGMEERCKIIGASLKIETLPNFGTGVVINWPASPTQDSPNHIKVKKGNSAS
jgi:two-component system sensor histidine kinase DegS